MRHAGTAPAMAHSILNTAHTGLRLLSEMHTGASRGGEEEEGREEEVERQGSQAAEGGGTSLCARGRERNVCAPAHIVAAERKREGPGGTSEKWSTGAPLPPLLAQHLSKLRHWRRDCEKHPKTCA